VACTMTDTAYTLPDGTRLLDHTIVDGRAFGLDEKTTKRCAYHGDDSGGRLVGRNGETIREIVAAAAGPQMGRSNAKHHAARSDRGRWHTFNTFIDNVARHLSPVDIAVWIILFRDCRNGTVVASNRDIGRRSACSLRAVVDSMKRLRAFGLIDAVRLSRHKGVPSLYSLNPSPDACLKAIMRPIRSGAAAAPDHLDGPTDQPEEPVQHVHRVEE
jgi:hypothetical protein